MEKLLVTYALLGYLKETSLSKAPIIELYVPIVKKALREYAMENNIEEYKGRSFVELSEKIKSIFGLNIPIPILSKIMEFIRDEIGDDKVFALYNDGAFIIKSMVFDGIGDILQIEKDNIRLLENSYKDFCESNNCKFDFEELKNFILASQIDLFTDKRMDLLNLDCYVPKFVAEKFDDEVIFKIMSNIYLGGIIASYLELNITKKVTDAELLLDTNFFISLIDLNTEDSYYICNQLYNLCVQLGFRLTMLGSTVEQIKVLLGNRINDFGSKEYIGTIRTADIFNACIRREIDKTALERIRDSVDYKIDELGIVVIQEAQIRYIIDLAKKSEDYKVLMKKRQNNEESALNDCVAKFYVKQKRGSRIQEFADVKCWFLHNSFSLSDDDAGHKIQDRYSISANELLVLLWLSSPAQGKDVKINNLTRGGLASYITKYRRAKMPSIEVLKKIKKRADQAVKFGKISEKDTYNLSIRMAEGYITSTQVDTQLISEEVSDDQFVLNLKSFSEEADRYKVEKEKQILNYQAKIKELEEIVSQHKEEKDSMKKEQNLIKQELEQLKLDSYNSKKEKYVRKKLKKVGVYTCGYILFCLAIIALWLINSFYSNSLNCLISTVISLFLFILPTFGLRFVNHTTIKELFFRKNLIKRLEDEYDQENGR